MSSLVLPSLRGFTHPLTRTSQWKTRTQRNISGKRVDIADWSYPIYTWSIDHSVLWQGTVGPRVNQSDLATLMGFFDQLLGGFDSFLFADPDDNQVTGQLIGTGTGLQTAFPLVRTFGGFVMPILAPNVVSKVYFNAIAQPGGNYTVAGWGSSPPGVLNFLSAPTAGTVITADFTYYFPCKWDSDRMSFERFMQGLYSTSKNTFSSLK